MSYLEEDRYTWRHNSALQILAHYFRANTGASLYVNLPSFHSPSLIARDNFLHDLVLVLLDNKIYVIKLTVGFETNLEVNAEHKRAKYQSLMETLRSKYADAKFVNLSISALGSFGLSCSTFIEIRDALAVNMGHRRFLISKLSNTIRRAIYLLYALSNTLLS